MLNSRGCVSKSHNSRQGQAVVLALTFLARSLLLLSEIFKETVNNNKKKKEKEKNEMKNKKVLDRQQETTKGN